MTDQDLIPLAEAVKRAGVSDKTLRRWIHQGRITGYRRGTSDRSPLLVDAQELSDTLQPVRVSTSRPERSKPRDNRPPSGPTQPPTPPTERTDKRPKKVA